MRNHAFEAQPRPCANGKHTVCLFGMPLRGSGVPGIGDLAFVMGFPGRENSKGKSLRDFAFKSKISQRFCFINFVKCLRGALKCSKTFTDFHRFSRLFNRAFSAPSGEIFTGLDRFSPDLKNPSPDGAKVISRVTRGLRLLSLAWVLSRACQQRECALGSCRLPKDACAARERGSVGGGGW